MKPKSEWQLDPHRSLHVEAPPHVQAGESTSEIMLWVVGGLAVIGAYAIYVLGTQAAVVMAASVGGAVGTEAFLAAARRRPQTVGDFSAVVTGLLLAFTLPPGVAWWVAVFGSVVAVGVAKEMFGGLGYNIFNPALVGRAVVMLSWPARMTAGWAQTYHVDATTGATALYLMKEARAGALAKTSVFADAAHYFRPLLAANRAGSIGEVSAVLIVAAGLVLIVKGIVDWRIPAAYVGTVALLTWLAGADVTFYLLAGGLMLGAFFMATDYVTAPVTALGRAIFGVGCGAVTVLLRFYSALPEGVMFAILFMNCWAPLIDRYTQPRAFGSPRWGTRGWAWEAKRP